MASRKKAPRRPKPPFISKAGYKHGTRYGNGGKKK